MPDNSIPSWESFMLPILKVMNDGVTRHTREVHALVAEQMQLNEAQLTEFLPTGQPRWKNRTGWANSYLTNIGALERAKRGHYVITDAGREVLSKFPDHLMQKDLLLLGKDPSSLIRMYQKSGGKQQITDTADNGTSDLTPIEQVQTGINRISEEVAEQLLNRLQGKDPSFFEEAVIQLLLAMGYGGTSGKGTVTALSNDGGIDGVIDQDILGLNRVYIQAKRYAAGNNVRRPDLQGFVGALSGKADSGVFITTSRFSEGAKTYAANVPTRIILIDGERLTELMIKFGVGVQTKDTYHVVEIDEDFFD